jgi:hypothetical protein
MRALRKLVLGETLTLPAGVGLVLVIALVLSRAAGSWWHDIGGFVVLGLVLAVLTASLAPAFRR